MKTFCDEIEPVEVELIDKDGNKEIKRGKLLTLKDIREIDQLWINRKKDGSDFPEVICKRTAIVFGGKPEDYEKYSFTLLDDVMRWYLSGAENPTNKV